MIGLNRWGAVLDLAEAGFVDLKSASRGVRRCYQYCTCLRERRNCQSGLHLLPGSTTDAIDAVACWPLGLQDCAEDHEDDASATRLNVWDIAGRLREGEDNEDRACSECRMMISERADDLFARLHHLFTARRI